MGWAEKLKKRNGVVPMGQVAAFPPTSSDNRPLLWIAIPTIRQRITIELHMFLLRLFADSMAGQIPFRIGLRIVNGRTPIAYARNVISGSALKAPDKPELVWMWDDDMTPDDTARFLLGSDADIVAATTYIWDGAGTSNDPTMRANLEPTLKVSAFWKDSSTLSQAVHGPMGEIPADGVGTATMLIKRKVLEDKRMWGPTKYSFDGQEFDLMNEYDGTDWAPPLFRVAQKPNGQWILGEDVDFCLRAKALGYSVRLFAGVEVGHRKEVDLKDVVKLVARHKAKSSEGGLRMEEPSRADRAGMVALGQMQL